jgi:hypothetical protein
MRSGLLAAVVAWAAGCGTGGLQFEVDASKDPGASQLWIYVGKGDGLDASIAAEHQKPGSLHDGKYWPLAFDDVEIYDLSAADRNTTISFVPGDNVDTITVVAVGITNDKPSSVATKTLASLRSDVVEIWDLVLQPASSTVDTPTSRAVVTWGVEPSQTTCVQAVDRGAPLQNVFIGLPGDKDCDGYQDGKPEECNDEWHNGSTTPSIETLSCLEEHSIPDPQTGMSDACMFGAPLCVDGRPEVESECSHKRPYCAPQGLCDACSSGNEVDRFDCALRLDPLMEPVVSFIKCDIDVNVAMSPPLVCDQRLVATPPLGWFNGDPSCLIKPPVFHASNRDGSWSTGAGFGGIALKFATLPGAPSCSVDILPMQVPGTPLDPSAYPQHGLIAVQLDSGMGVVAPIVFDVKPVSSCDPGAVRSCYPSSTIANETIGNCVQHAPVPAP